MRANLLAGLRAGKPFLPGILGYDETVVPQLENAILAGQDVILLGERGQAKSRIARGLIGLLDPWLPYLAGTELHDDPLRPVSPLARTILAEEGDAARIGWWAAEDRYSEKLATPVGTGRRGARCRPRTAATDRAGRRGRGRCGTSPARAHRGG